MGKQWKQWLTLFFWAPKSQNLQDGDCSHEIKRRLLLGRKVMTNLDSIFKSRDITLPTKVCLVKVMIFPVVMYGCESWTVKKAEHQRIDAFELWCWRRLLRVLWTARKSNQSVLKEISPGCSLVGLMLKVKLQYFGYLMWRVDSLEKTLMLGGIWGQEEKGTTEDEMAEWHHLLDGREFEWIPGVGDGTGRPGVLQFMGSQRVRHDWATELNWKPPKRQTEVPICCCLHLPYGHCIYWVKTTRITKRGPQGTLIPLQWEFKLKSCTQHCPKIYKTH